VSAGAGFAYRAVQPSGRTESGVVRAESPEAAREMIRAQGLFPLEVHLERQVVLHRPGIPVADLALGLRVLATLLDSGLPLARSIGALDPLVPASWGPGLPVIRASIREGKSLGAALQALPFEVPPLVIGLISVGEAGGGLAAAVVRAAELMESAAEARRQIWSALAYPFVLALSGAASVALLVGVVLPRFAAILHDLGQSLPPATRLVLDVAYAGRTASVPLLVGLVLLLVLWRLWTSSETGRMQWHAVLLGLPYLGEVRRAAATGRFSAALGALLESGVPIATAMSHAAGATGDAALGARIRSAREGIVGGERPSAALAAADALTPTAVRLIRAGEETGRLPEMLTQAARLESTRAEQQVRAGVRFVEPALILLFGGVVAVVAAALLQAVYHVRPMP
jgi:general secretion pathway protein F